MHPGMAPDANGGIEMTNEECAKWLVELHAAYFDLNNRYGNPAEPAYAEAVAMAIMSLGERERRTDGN